MREIPARSKNVEEKNIHLDSSTTLYINTQFMDGLPVALPGVELWCDAIEGANAMARRPSTEGGIDANAITSVAAKATRFIYLTQDGRMFGDYVSIEGSSYQYIVSTEMQSDGSIGCRFLEMVPRAAGKGLLINPMDDGEFYMSYKPDNPESWQARYAANGACKDGLYFHQWCGADIDGQYSVDKDVFNSRCTL